ncbi:hypothetical protein OUZ56_011550 [Daphnia magna]|uniref:Uncharacterized protein n=1 Tax=Daphnia magna TaxID=35525 RepID=A0ABQ9Z0F9_9CRUS|nr:hypothetical protein OUZ56_011550 [Daphnia magna]
MLARAYPRNQFYWSQRHIASWKTFLSIFFSTGICTYWSTSIACPAGRQYTGGTETRQQKTLLQPSPRTSSTKACPTDSAQTVDPNLQQELFNSSSIVGAWSRPHCLRRPTRATQQARINGILPGRDCPRPQPTLNLAGPSFFLCIPLESSHDGALSPGHLCRQSESLLRHTRSSLSAAQNRNGSTHSKRKEQIMGKVLRHRSHQEVPLLSRQVCLRERLLEKPTLPTSHPRRSCTPYDRSCRNTTTPPHDVEDNGIAPNQVTDRPTSDFPPRRSHRERRAPNRLDL